MTINTDEIRRLLEPLVETLQADGFELEVHLRDHELEVEVIGDAARCAECLVPQPVFRSMVEDVLQPVGDEVGLDNLRVTYPTT